MREGIHPEYVEATVHCSCGNTFTTRSTKSKLTVELCDLCHPFYTGQQKFVDTGGRVQRFADKFGGGAAETVVAKEAAAKAARQKAHEDSVIAARQVREIREREEAEIARKAAARAPKAEVVVEEAAPVADEVVAETVETVEDVAAETTEASAE